MNRANGFWDIIESSWGDSPEWNKKRLTAVQENDKNTLEVLSEVLENLIRENYKKRLLTLSKIDLTSFIHNLEENLYEIDRQSIHEFTDGSDDGFLYCRCFIVGMGEEYYNKIKDKPSEATFDLEAELFGFSAYEFYEEKFGEEFDRNSKYCIESCSNTKHWNL